MSGPEPEEGLIRPLLCWSPERTRGRQSTKDKKEKDIEQEERKRRATVSRRKIRKSRKSYLAGVRGFWRHQKGAWNLGMEQEN